MSQAEWIDEFPMNMDDDYDDPVPERGSPLDNLAVIALDIQKHSKLTSFQLRHHLMDRKLVPLAVSQGLNSDIILSYSTEDVEYKSLVSELYPTVLRFIDKFDQSRNQSILVELLSASLSMMLWEAIESRVASKSMNTEQFTKIAQDHCGTLAHFVYKDFPITDFVKVVSVERQSLDKDNIEIVLDLYKVFKALDSTEQPDVIQPEEVAPPIKSKMTYIEELAAKGFQPIDNTTEIACKTGIHNTLVGLIKLFYTASPLNSLNFKDKVYMVNQSILESHGLNPKEVDIWNPGVYSKDEDLMFRTFIKEDDISFTILIKLPHGLSNFDFSKKKDELEAIPSIFSNMDASKGSTYSSNLMKQPRVCNLGSTRKVSTAYDCIEITLSKDLMAFKNANWLLRDYIKANQGVQNDFSSFDNLSLGEKIVVGVMPGALKAERFDCSGKYNVSGIVGGGAGSGKTAMYDSLLVQAVALQGVEGNGAVVLIDQKQEWIPIWRNVFNQLNIPFYGFDGEVLNSQELKWVDIKRGEKVVESIPFKVNSYIGGILFVRVIYETIQVILKEKGCSNIIEFNQGNHNYKGITRLPRSFIMVDELNSLYATIKGDSAVPFNVYKGLILARLTRTSGFNWLLGGQDPSRTLIASDERSNYNYNIMGKMADERYDYFDVTQNRAVQDYEQKHGTSDNPNPILSQGVFYAGPKGKTDIVKCLYVPKDERLDAIKDLNSSLNGMRELDKVVRLALAEGYFDKFEVTLGKPNNIVYAVLRNLGVISQKEFDLYSDRVLNGTSDDASGALDDALNVNGKKSEVISNTSSNNQQTRPTFGSNDSLNRKNDVKETATDREPFNHNRSEQKDSVFKDPYVSPLNRTAHSATFDETIEMKESPFEIFDAEGNPISAIAAIRITSAILMDEIKKMVGDFSRIESFEVTSNGLVINNIAFRPKFSQKVMDSMPFEIRMQVKTGNVVELFHFQNIFKFKNLQSLRIDNARLAEGRVRREIGWNQRKSWHKLFNKFRKLIELYIGGERITDEVTAKEYDNRGRGGFTLTEKLRRAFGLEVKAVSSSHMERVWDSKPVRAMGNAIGWTLALKGVTLAATMLGPWGLVFAGLAGYSAYRELRKRSSQQKTKR